MYLSSRERHILKILLEAEKEMPVKDIAGQLGVSIRTIHREIKKTEKVLEDYQLNLTKKTGTGIIIQGSLENKNVLQQAIEELSSAELTEEERQVILLYTLLQFRDPVKLFHLATELNVTIAMVSQDLNKLESQVKSFGLSLIRKKGYGVRIEGDEARKRSVLSHLISRHIDPFQYVEKLKERIQEDVAKSDTISARLLGLVDADKLDKIEEQIQRMRHQLPYDLADSAYIGLVVHLALAIERLQKGDTIHFDDGYKEQIKDKQEYKIAAEIIDHLEEAFSLSIPEDEIGYITMHLMGAKLRENQNYLLEESSMDIAYKAKELIRFVSNEMNIDVTTNNRFLNDLTTHLKPAVYRLKQQMNINNPMIDEIKKDYVELFEVVDKAIQHVFPNIAFPDEEIGYIVLHFAATFLQTDSQSDIKVLVICSSGIGTSKMLASKLKNTFPEISIANHQSLFDLNEETLSGYDVIVSTVALEDINRSYVLISPLLTDEEARKIKVELRKSKITAPIKKQQMERRNSQDDFVAKLYSMQLYSKAMIQLINNLKVTTLAKNTDMLSYLQLIGKEIEQAEIVTQADFILEKLVEREQQGGLGIPLSQLALFHTRSEWVQGPYLRVYELEQPIYLKGMDNTPMMIKRILLMLAPQSSDSEVLNILSFISGLFIQKEENIRIFEYGTEEDIHQFLANEFQNFMNEKFHE
ncbi:BglG family transcription antiterminator [Oceanobacillus kimchii]|uniref:BglG family transcription antiterminator n=1 Tax=Oceanobacillus kimchii TaxID=746691 RepID=UPI0003606612|nr:BglG family transcription antiterminator [Oceanobacillus kimchii]MCT1578121.1 BglG family transcription antiterminator [Oceanobacillus kimchii]